MQFRYVPTALTALVVSIASIGFVVPRAEACMCHAPASIEDALAAADWVFTGSATHNVVVGNLQITQFSTSIVFKGPEAVEVSVVSDATHCGWEVALHEQYLVYTQARVPGAAVEMQQIDHCGRTALRDGVQDELNALGEPVFHAPSRFDVDELNDESAELVARFASGAVEGEFHVHIERSEGSIRVELTSDALGEDLVHAAVIDTTTWTVEVEARWARPQ